MNIKKLTNLSIATLASLSFSTVPVFATGGGAGGNFTETGSEAIVVDYRSLTRESNAIANLVGDNQQEITTDMGYAWDDLSFTYVRDIQRTSTLTTTGGYAETTAVTNGTWYRGSYDDQEALDADANAIALPRKTMDDYEANANDVIPTVTDDEFAILPKIVVHNYSTHGSTFYFSMSNDDLANYNAKGQLLFIDNYSYRYDAHTYYGGYGNFEVAANSTLSYGVLPIVFESNDVTFNPFAVSLTIHFESGD